jgi:myo-inositol-1(or 4)-monophosphatase
MLPPGIVELAEEMAHQAGALLLERAGGPVGGVATKSSPTDFVSDADRESEALLLGRLAAQRPDDAVLGEETGEAPGSSGLRWVLDPLDGTTNYLYGFPSWSVVVAVEDAEGAAAGVVFDPGRDETFVAVRGGGAKLNGRPIAVSEAQRPEQALVGTGFSYSAEARVVQARALAAILPAVRDIRRAGSAALDLCWVACGRLDGFYEGPLKHWDSVAGALMVAEAGGRVSPLPAIDRSGDGGVLAAPPGLHDPLRQIILGALRPGDLGRDLQYTQN